MDQTLMTFRNLSRPNPGEDPGEQQRRASEQLANVVSRSSLGWWSPDQPRPEGPSILLIGAAVWSGYDLNLLDHVDGAVRTGLTDKTQVFVFNADTIQSQEQIDAIMPGIGFAHHTPFVGYWRDGVLVDVACGYEGRQLVARVLNIDEKYLNQRFRAMR